MKKLFTVTTLLFIAAITFGQTFNSPESVDYDAPRHRWMVGQNGSGEIHILNGQTMALTPFCSGIPSGPHGIECVGDTLFCCDGATIKGYNLLTGAQVSNVNLGATFLNGLTWDGGDYLYATDFTAKKIFKYQISTGTYTAVVTGLTTSPNGIIYDGAGNRCVFVSWGSNAPIKSMDLSTYNTTTVMTTTLGNCDGITRDLCGNWYVSAWTGNKLVKVNGDFSGTPVSVLTGLSSPADLDINTSGDSIAIPNSGTGNNVSFYSVPVVNFNAQFTQNSLSVCEGNGVQFTDQSTGCLIEAWEWTFEGGQPQTATMQNPTVIYNMAGVYDVKLIVYDHGGVSDSVVFTNYITVNPLPAAPVVSQLNDSTLQSSQSSGNQWNDSNGPVSGATGPTFKPAASGDYTVTYTDANGCSATSAPYTFTSTLGVETLVSDAGMIYPNPATNGVTIVLKEAALNGTVSLTNLSGQTIVTGTANGPVMLFDRGALPAGTYFIAVRNAENVTVFRQKIVFTD